MTCDRRAALRLLLAPALLAPALLTPALLTLPGRSIAADAPPLDRSNLPLPALEGGQLPAASLVGQVVPGPIGDLLPVLGLVLPGLFLQDLWRFALFAEHLPRLFILR